MLTQRISKAAFTILIGAFAASILAKPSFADDEKNLIAIADVKHDGPVEFEKEILPIFRRNCLACHNSTEAESGLVLETPQSILKGGTVGPSVVAGKSAESLLLMYATGAEVMMPPADNDVGAKPLTPEQLGLIKLWIDEGAKGEVTGLAGAPNWQPLPPGVNPIYTVAVSPDGQYAAAGRANQVFMFHLPSKRELGRLTDPTLLESKIYNKPGVAFYDVVQSLAFSPDGNLLAAGGYRTLKLFRRTTNAKTADLAGLENVRCFVVSKDGKWAAAGEESGKVKVIDLASRSVVKTLEGHTAATTGVTFSADGSKLLTGSQDKKFRLWNVADAKQIGPAIETAAPINAVALVGEEKLAATGHADNVIRTWALPTDAPAEATEGAEAAEPPKPIKELAGHGGPVTSLASVQANGSQLVSGSADGTVRHWDVANGTQIRAMTHGGPVESISVRADFTKFASASANNSAKIWNAADGKQLFELKGDFRTRLKVEEVTRAVALAKRRIDLAKADLDAANKRKEAEDKNAATAEENRKKAEEEFKKKEEAAKKPVADKEAADKALVAAQEAEKVATETQKTAGEAATKADEALKKAQADLVPIAKAATDADAAAKAAADALKKAQDAAKADAENKDLAAAVTAAEKALQDAEAAKKAADEAKVAADKVVADADAVKKAADEAKKKADAEFTAAQAKTKAEDANVKKLTPAAQKATDEKNAAERAMQAAERSVTRAKDSVKKAADAIPVADAAMKKEEEKHKQRTAELEGATKVAAESEKPLKSIAFSVDGATLAVGGDDQLIHSFDSETGQPIDTFAGQGAAITALAASADGIISVAANNTTIVWNTASEWKLERTIGTMDDPSILVDRVTALGFSRDGKMLASGSGEPSRSGQIKIWNVADGALIRELKEPHSDTVFAIEFSPEDDYLATCAADRFMKVFQVSDGAFVRSFEGHTHHVLGVSWSADGRTLASSGADKVIKIWNFQTGDQARTIQPFNKELTSIKFVGDSINIVASCGDKNVHIRRSDNGGAVRSLSGGADYMYSVDVSADGKVFAAGGQDSVLRIWNDAGAVLGTFGPPKEEEKTAQAGG